LGRKPHALKSGGKNTVAFYPADWDPGRGPTGERGEKRSLKDGTQRGTVGIDAGVGAQAAFEPAKTGMELETRTTQGEGKTALSPTRSLWDGATEGTRRK